MGRLGAELHGDVRKARKVLKGGMRVKDNTMKALVRLAAALPAAIAAAAVLGSCMEKKKDALEMSIKDFNNSLRWKKYQDAAGYLPPELRGPFIEAAEKDEKDLNITDYEFKDQFVDRELGKAVVRVKITWYKNNEAVEKSGHITQRWVARGDAWVIEAVTGEGPWKKEAFEPDKELMKFLKADGGAADAGGDR
jgi:hypothetical protein